MKSLKESKDSKRIPHLDIKTLKYAKQKDSSACSSLIGFQDGSACVIGYRASTGCVGRGIGELADISFPNNLSWFPGHDEAPTVRVISGG